jgi:hypothetical protein
MSRPSLLIALSLALAPGLLFAQETTVYKSKNADGTSVYTQIETRGAEKTQLDGRDPKAPPAEAKPKPKTDTELACERAQTSLDLLGSGKTLQRDKDGDGKPEPLTPEELTSERDLAERQAAAYCPKPKA